MIKAGQTLLVMLLLLGLGREGHAELRKPFLLIGTGPVTGIYFAAGHAVAKVVNRNQQRHPYRLDALASAGSVENIERVLAGEWGLGIAQADLLYQATQGLGPWKNRPASKLRAVASLYSEALTIITAASSNITSLAELRGKTLSIGESGSADNANMREILRLAGIDPEKDLELVEKNPVESTELLQQRRIDGYCFTVGHPNFSLVEALYGQVLLRLVEMEPAVSNQILEHKPWMQTVRIEKKLYPKLTNRADVLTVGVKAVLFARADLPKETVASLVGELWADFPRFQRQHPAFLALRRETLGETTPIPYHPGAIAVLREAGITP